MKSERKKTPTFAVRNKVFYGGTHIMGILNLTPDSFYPESRVDYNTITERAVKMIEDGAEILDIGAQSTRPSAEPISAEEECERLLPALARVRLVAPYIPISVDTYYPEVAREALKNGADMINDTSCLAHGGMAEIIAESDASVCVMHNRRESEVEGLLDDKFSGFGEAIKKLFIAGVDKTKIMLDLGIGFNKNANEDWLLIRRERMFTEFYENAFLLGTSMKSLFGGDVNDRLKATLETTRTAAEDGILFVRVHDVAANKQVINDYYIEKWESMAL